MSVKTHAPVTVLYRADLRDTAILVGLIQKQIPIGMIAYTGELDCKTLDYIAVVNKWLKEKRQPIVSIHPHLSMDQLERILVDPLSDWGWREDECKAVLTLNGIPNPQR
jgi:hypothetical protein